MKHIRISKRDPSKILKIIEDPHTSRLNHHMDISQDISISQQPSSNQYIKQYSYRENASKMSPKPTSRPAHFGSLSIKKPSIKLVNRSQELVRRQQQKSVLQRSSQQIKGKSQMSPYIRRYKFKQSQKSLNFNSVSCNQRQKILKIPHQHKNIKASQQIIHRTRRDSSPRQYSQDSQIQQKADDKILLSARNLINQGDYRKSLLILKSILKGSRNHAQSLFLSGVNWYHLDDKAKAITAIQTLFSLYPGYSVQSYKLISVCYFKSLDFDKSLSKLQECHKYFPFEYESYQIEAKIHVKRKNWQLGLKNYKRASELNKNNLYLVEIANCLYQLQNYEQSLKYFQKFSENQKISDTILLKMLKMLQKNKKYSQIIDLVKKQQILIGKLAAQNQQQIYYTAAYSAYQLSNFFQKIESYDIIQFYIREGLQYTTDPIRFDKLLLMTKIQQRDIYEAYRLTQHILQQPDLKVIMYFIEGVINLMRRNYNQGIAFLQSIRKDLGFDYDLKKTQPDTEQLSLGHQIEDQFQTTIRKIFPLFLSYAYFNISQFYLTRLLMNLQKTLGVPEYFKAGLEYNQAINEGIISHCQRRFIDAQTYFTKAYDYAPCKLEPPFSLALNYLQIMVLQQQASQKQMYATKAQILFQKCQEIIGNNKTNAAASIHYFHSLLYGYQQDWKNALQNIELSIEKSQDHYWRYFYLNGMFLACAHNFPQAISSLNAAVTLSQGNRPQCYLLRSRCLQIQGQGGDAFKDLQDYIALKPDDTQVHKFAGQLLFQNGAFEDALMAFNHDKIPETIENYDVFLTQAKSFFLMGSFKQAQEIMMKAHKIKQTQQVFFDILVLQLVDILVQKPTQSIRLPLMKLYQEKRGLGRIFKLPDLYVFLAICDLRAGKVTSAMISFQKAVLQKQQQLGKSEDDQECLLEIKTQLQSYKNQMLYNITLCNLLLEDWSAASQTCSRIKIALDQSYYSDFVNFRKFINRQNSQYRKEEVFPSKNKMSNHIQKLKIDIERSTNIEKSNMNNETGKQQQKRSIFLKLCFPFPKVQPPEIYPSFDRSLLQRVSVLNVERKPEAPWIIRQNSSIKFTDKIQTFSQLQLQESEFQSKSSFQSISIDQSHISHTSSHRRLNSLKSHKDIERKN